MLSTQPSQPHEQPSADQLTRQGVAQAEKGRRQQAIAHFRRAIGQEPGFAKAHHNLGVALAQEGQPEDAVRCLREALRLRPDYFDALANLGSVHLQMKCYQDAVNAFRRALELRPVHADTLNNLGLALFYLGQLGEAVILLRHALRVRPDFREAHNNLGMALTDLGDFRAAADVLEHVLRMDPRYAEAHTNLGNNFKEQGRLAEAIACYDLAVAVGSQTVSPRWNRALVRLQQGDYPRGWADYEWRLKKPDSGVRRFPQPMWDGSPLAGRTILLHMEQGLGDMIQFIRYAALVRRQGGRVIVSSPARLLKLFARCPGIDALVDEKSELAPFDVQAPLLSLPALLKTTVETIPAEVPYLFAEDGLVMRWKERLAHVGGLRVGVCWQGNPRFRADRERSFPLAQLEPLARIPGVSLISLQWGPGTEQLAAAQRRFSIVDLGGGLDQENGGFMDTAAVLKNVDLVVTADTAMAHLAGALGVPVWLGLAWAADWRWLMDRDDSPWYPTARLFRQKRRGAWPKVFRRMATELRARVGAAPLFVEVGCGELVDKITILEIKQERISDPVRQKNVAIELEMLRPVYRRLENRIDELAGLKAELKIINAALWESEERIRAKEQAADFGEEFIALARSVYKTNDRRAEVKRIINDRAGSRIVEEKLYQS
jgi:tetratricopeptide (TPR) repeat protein